MDASEAGRALPQATSEECRVTVCVTKLSGEVIVDKVELKGSEKVAVIIDKVETALGNAQRVDLITNGGKLLNHCSSVEDC